MKKIRWGILSTAKIGRENVIPALQAGNHCEVVAIASRNKELAAATAADLNIPQAFGSYEELLASNLVDAIYIPLPNHLHVEWSIKTLQAGKHVLCEKPIGLTVAEAEHLLITAKQYPKLKIMEAFMYRFHPQWQLAKKMVSEKKIGELKTIHSFFSYYNSDPHNIRNQKDIGGGAMMDIGCYCISLARFLFDEEPVKVSAKVEYDPVFKTDHTTSGILEFSKGTSTFTCSTQLMPYQRVNIMGTEGRIEIDIPFNAPAKGPTKMLLFSKTGVEESIFNNINQYTIEGDRFALAILNDEPVLTPLEDAINNMKVMEAIFKSGSEKRQVTV